MSYLHPHALAHGFQRAVLIAGSWCIAGGVLAAVGIRNPARGLEPSEAGPSDVLTYCALEATPLRQRGGRRAIGYGQAPKDS